MHHLNTDVHQHAWTKQFFLWTTIKIKAPDSKRCLWMQIERLTWWDCLAVFQYNVILECAGLAGCQAVECVCDWWVWERVRKYSVTQESNVAACGFLTGSIVVEGDMFSWGKARPVLSPPPTPQTLRPPKHPGDPSNYTNCINCTVKEDRAFLCSILCFYQLCTVCV